MRMYDNVCLDRTQKSEKKLRKKDTLTHITVNLFTSTCCQENTN